MIKLLFICHGNICRSTMAEFVMKDMAAKAGLADKLYIDSAATSREEIGHDVDPRTRQKLKENGVPCGHHKARQITPEDYEEFDYLIPMDEENLYGMRRILGESKMDTTRLLLSFAGKSRDIADPWYTHNFDETYKDVVMGCEGIIEMIKRGEL